MSQSIIVRSFAELGELLGADEPETALPDEQSGSVAEVTGSQVSVAVEGHAPDLTNLLAQLEAATSTLATLARQDQEARTLALRDLERYEGLTRQADEARQAEERAYRVQLDASALVATAFTDEAREAAERVVSLATQAEAVAGQVAAERQAEAERLAGRPDVEKLIAERQRKEEEEKARAAEIAASRRLSGALASARESVEAGRFEEARTLLGSVASENPGNADVASLEEMIAQRELAVKVRIAEEALWQARREYRQDLAAAITRLTALDVDGLPSPLASQVFGEWARACSRLCREQGIAEPLRYAPNPGRGAVLARESTGQYVVVSALGMGSAWQPGEPVDERQVRRARPLR